MSKFQVLSAAAAVALFTTASAHALSLRDAIDYAVRTNPQISAAQASRRATDHVLEQAKGRYYPEISLNADVGAQKIDRPNGFGPNDNDKWRTRRQVSLTFRQQLFDGFERLNGMYQAHARIRAASYKVLARAEVVALSVVEAYIDVVRHRSLLGLANSNVKRHRQLLQLVQDRVAGGKNAAGDLEQTRERLEAAIALQAQVKISLDVANAKFKAAVGKRARKLHKVRPAKLGFRQVSSAVGHAIENNPRLQAIRSEIDVAGFEKDKFTSSLYPQLTFEGSAQRGEDLEGTPGRSDELRAMVVLQWKLFDGGVREARVSELTEREYVEIAEHDSFARELTAEVEIAWSKAIEGRRRVAALGRQVKQNNGVVAAYRNEYEADKRSLLDVLDAENSRFASQFDLSNASAIQRFSTYQLAANTGRLLDLFNISRPAGADVAVAPSRVGGSSRSSYSFTIPPLK